jgi:uncharacterized Zn-finger protein
MYLRQNKLPEFQIFGIDPKVFIDINKSKQNVITYCIHMYL